MKTREVKRSEALAREALRATRSVEEQRSLIASRPGSSQRELDRLGGVTATEGNDDGSERS